MIRMGVVGLGKMGLSHLSMVGAHPDVSVDAVVDSTGYILDVLGRYTGMRTFGDYQEMLDGVELDAVLIATPTRFHAPMVRSALERGLHVFCEKPLCLTAAESRELAEMASERGLVTQVGYHNRFVGAFKEVRRLLDLGAIGKVSHVLVEAYGPVVLRPKGSTWRSKRTEGGGALYDYAAHPIDLAAWYAGVPYGVGGTVLGGVFSTDTEDEVFSTLFFDQGTSAQVSVNWSDESYRKMTTQVTITGTGGRIHADRQEVQVYLRSTAPEVDGYEPGWNVKYTTELTDPVWFYLRGEEYSAQLDHFVRRIGDPALPDVNSFASAAVTDRVLEMLTIDAAAGPTTLDAAAVAPLPVPQHRRSLLRRRA
ncbi:Gfo/Idh/MocA family protein [Agromyces salentinus]|uniref:Gfo/Idh/MocA family oxidoreductase n=1 Tax=Agromyces salentinus TaxID=269421 RepID=A0ABP4YUQ0_9MICO|nr:Gfo/Idh/MocA family oxidoreductase [Agromyces salentinus]